MLHLIGLSLSTECRAIPVYRSNDRLGMFGKEDFEPCSKMCNDIVHIWLHILDLGAVTSLFHSLDLSCFNG